MAPILLPVSPTIKHHCSIVILGASGDLSFKKTYPALFGLYKHNHLPQNIHFIGYARSKLETREFRGRISSKIKIHNDREREQLEEFLELCSYVAGSYDKEDDYIKLELACQDVEEAHSFADRLFYMALPPSVFAAVSKGVKSFVYSQSGSNRIIVEKPFGKDSESSRALSVELSKSWNEEEIYRIDHYLGKEMVKNLMVLRFANVFYGAVWNREHINNVQITFKEAIGTQGRGGYFDEFGIIRDVMQNHLLQILSIVAMEKPKSLDAEDIRNEKVKVLNAINPLTLDKVMVGQYMKSADGKEEGYLDDKTVPEGSLAPTFAAAVFEIHNSRWEGVPFIVKCGKALNEQKCEIRIQFNDPPDSIYKDTTRNELVIRVQPQEAVYMKFMNKQPGLNNTPVISELDLSYQKRYSDIKIPDAYESLILDCLRGDKSNFVRDDELEAAWKIFTPLLKELEHVKPEPYSYGTRGPAKLNIFIEKHGYARDTAYTWSKI